MVEYSAGYKAKAQQRLDVLDGKLKGQALSVAKALSEHFEASSTKERSAKALTQSEAA